MFRYLTILLIISSLKISYGADLNIPLACPFTIDSSHTDLSCYLGFDGSINIEVSDGVPPYTFDWDNNIYDGMNNLNFLPSGTYTVTITDSDGCSDTLVFNLDEPEEFLPDCSDVVFPSGPLALDGSINFSFVGGEAPFTIEWLDNNLNLLGSINTNIRNHLIENLPAQNIVVRVIDANNCTTTCTASLLKNECPLELEVDVRQNVCPDDIQGRIAINPIGANEPIIYDWNIDQYDGLSTLENLTSGTYSLYAIDAIGCDTSLTIEIVSGNDWSINCRELTQQSDLNILDGSIEVNLQNVMFPITVISDALDTNYVIVDSIDQLIFDNLKYGIYDIKIIDPEDCEQTCQVEVTINLPEPRFYIPSAFSPNGDGNNDYFEIYTNEAIQKIKHVSIFNKWGDRVYEVNNIASFLEPIAWDGTFKGEALNPGEFAYKVTLVTYLEEEINFSGSFTLLR